MDGRDDVGRQERWPLILACSNFSRRSSNRGTQRSINGFCTPDQDIDRVPQCAAFLTLGRRQPVQRFVVQQPV